MAYVGLVFASVVPLFVVTVVVLSRVLLRDYTF